MKVMQFTINVYGNDKYTTMQYIGSDVCKSIKRLSGFRGGKSFNCSIKH